MKFPNLLPKWPADGDIPGFVYKAVGVLGLVMMGAVLLVTPDDSSDKDSCSCRCREVVREEAAAHLRDALRAWEREPLEAAERVREAERIRRMVEQAERVRDERIEKGAAVRAGEPATEEGDAVAEPAAEVDR